MQSITDNQKKKRGRPATGITPLVGVRLTGATIKAVDQWAKRNGFDTRADAIRHFIEIGMKAKKR